jgi:small GTP-binding protein
MSKFTKCRADIKIVVIGNSGTGKTSFCKRWINDTFDNTYKATITSDFSYKIHKFEGNYYKIQFWDIAGQDKNIYTSKIFTKDSHGCLIFSDITNEDSLQKTLLWKKSIDENTKFIDGQLLPSVLVLNKSDLANEEQMSNDKEMEEFVKNNKFDGFFRTSCLNGNGIQDVIEFILKNIVQRLEAYSKLTNTPFDNTNRTSIVIQNEVKKNDSLLTSRKCCNYI